MILDCFGGSVKMSSFFFLFFLFGPLILIDPQILNSSPNSSS